LLNQAFHVALERRQFKRGSTISLACFVSAAHTTAPRSAQMLAHLVVEISLKFRLNALDQKPPACKIGMAVAGQFQFQAFDDSAEFELRTT
jgi:hypothetical protein